MFYHLAISVYTYHDISTQDSTLLVPPYFPKYVCPVQIERSMTSLGPSPFDIIKFACVVIGRFLMLSFKT